MFSVPLLLAIVFCYCYQRQSAPTRHAGKGISEPVITTTDTASIAAQLAQIETEALERAESIARHEHSSPRAAGLASESAVSTGRIAKGAIWLVEATLRKVREAGHEGEATGAAVRSYGLIALTLHLESFATQISRELLRSLQGGLGVGLAHAHNLGRVCGAESEPSRALEAAVLRAAETNELPRAVTAAFVAQCAVHQSAAAALVLSGADGARRHIITAPNASDAFTLMHLLAHYGDARLVHDVAAALPTEQLMAQLRTLGTPAGVTPVALATARGYDECAAVLAALADGTALSDPSTSTQAPR